MAPLIGTFKWRHTQSLLYPFSLLIIVYPLSSRQPHTDSWVRHAELTKWLPTWDSPGQCITMQCYCFFVLWLSQHWDPPDMGEYSYKKLEEKRAFEQEKIFKYLKICSLCSARHHLKEMLNLKACSGFHFLFQPIQCCQSVIRGWL